MIKFSGLVLINMVLGRVESAYQYIVNNIVTYFLLLALAAYYLMNFTRTAALVYIQTTVLTFQVQHWYSTNEQLERFRFYMFRKWKFHKWKVYRIYHQYASYLSLGQLNNYVDRFAICATSCLQPSVRRQRALRKGLTRKKSSWAIFRWSHAHKSLKLVPSN
jgi:hypothetical protein